MTVAEAPGVDAAAFERYAGKPGYFSMIFDFGWENLEGENDKSSIHAVERWKKKMFTHVAHNSGIGWSCLLYTSLRQLSYSYIYQSTVLSSHQGMFRFPYNP